MPTFILHACIAGILLVGTTQGARIERDIEYGPVGDASRRLDLHLPEVPEGYPTVVFFHGGSLLETGERRDSPMYAGVCPALTKAGVACATVDYRLAPSFTWPTMPQDAASAFAWVKSNIAARGGDPATIFLFGHSSGCQLAAVLGANPALLAAHGLAAGDVAGIVAMGCVLSPTEDVLDRYSVDELRARWPSDDAAHPTIDTWLDADASRHIGAHMPPTLVLLARRERFFPAILEQGAKFVRRLLELQRPADVVVVPGSHVSSIRDFGKPGDPSLAAVLAFIGNAGRMPD